MPTVPPRRPVLNRRDSQPIATSSGSTNVLVGWGNPDCIITAAENEAPAQRTFRAFELVESGPATDECRRPHGRRAFAAAAITGHRPRPPSDSTDSAWLRSSRRLLRRTQRKSLRGNILDAIFVWLRPLEVASGSARHAHPSDFARHQGSRDRRRREERAITGAVVSAGIGSFPSIIGAARHRGSSPPASLAHPRRAHAARIRSSMERVRHVSRFLSWLRRNFSPFIPHQSAESAGSESSAGRWPLLRSRTRPASLAGTKIAFFCKKPASRKTNWKSLACFGPRPAHLIDTSGSP